jgi:hypothetical protein
LLAVAAKQLPVATAALLYAEALGTSRDVLHNTHTNCACQDGLLYEYELCGFWKVIAKSGQKRPLDTHPKDHKDLSNSLGLKTKDPKPKIHGQNVALRQVEVRYRGRFLKFCPLSLFFEKQGLTSIGKDNIRATLGVSKWVSTLFDDFRIARDRFRIPELYREYRSCIGKEESFGIRLRYRQPEVKTARCAYE